MAEKLKGFIDRRQPTRYWPIENGVQGLCQVLKVK